MSATVTLDLSLRSLLHSLAEILSARPDTGGVD